MTFNTEIKEVKRREKLYYDVCCDGCNSPLKKVGPDLEEDGDGWRYLQADDALILKLEGGYAMAIDPIHSSEDELTTIFCGECTIKLCEQWPAISKIVQQNCSSSLGHECSKERKFVWKTLTDCCTLYCSECGRSATTTLGPEDGHDQYGRVIVDCHSCGQNLGIWAWEVKNFLWHVYQWLEKEKISKFLTAYHKKEDAETFCSTFTAITKIPEDEIWVEKAADVPR